MPLKKYTSDKEPVELERTLISLVKKGDIVILALYLLAEFIPALGSWEVMGSQWLYISLLNVFVTIFLFIDKRFINNTFFKSTSFLLYLSFLVISGVSFIVSYNKIESIVTYSRLLTSFIALINIISIIRYDLKILKTLFILIGLFAFFQSCEILFSFFKNTASFSNLDTIIDNIKGNAGHKNILAACLVVKLPFLIYAFHVSSPTKRILFLFSFFLSCFALCILNARSSFMGLIFEILIYLFIQILFFTKERKKLSLLTQPLWVTGTVIFSFFVYQRLITLESKGKIQQKYGSVISRMQTINYTDSGSTGRTIQWNNAINFIEKHPILGGGYGNWKVNTVYYEKTYEPSFIYNGRHVHNDFLEVAADTGILNGLLYLGIFLCLLIYVLLALNSHDSLLSNKITAITLLMALGAYMLEAALNFPLERPGMQILWCFLFAPISLIYLDTRRKKQWQETAFTISGKMIVLLFLFSGFTVYINYEVFRSMQVQLKISDFWISSNSQVLSKTYQTELPFKSEEINPEFPWIPNINELGMPIECIKAQFLFDEGKYNEALKTLNSNRHSDSNIHYSEFLHALIAEKLNQNDSAFFYAKLGFYNRPINIQMYILLHRLAFQRRDSAELRKSFNEFTKHYLWYEFWCIQAQDIYSVTGNPDKSLNVVEEALKQFPPNNELNYLLNFFKGISCFNNRDFPNAINLFKEALKYKDDDLAKQNIALSYFNQQLFPEAILYFTQLINSPSFKDGKLEFYRGLCYFNEGKKDSACIDYNKAKVLGYAVDPSFLKECH